MEVLYHMRPYFAGIYSHKIVGISSRFLSVADRALEIISAPKGNDHALGLYGDAHLSEKRWLYNVIYIYSPSFSLYSLSLYIHTLPLYIYYIHIIYIYYTSELAQLQFFYGLVVSVVSKVDWLYIFSG